MASLDDMTREERIDLILNDSQRYIQMLTGEQLLQLLDGLGMDLEYSEEE